MTQNIQEFIAQIENSSRGRIAKSMFHKDLFNPAPDHEVGAIVRVFVGKVEQIAPPHSALSRIYEILARFGLNPVPAAELLRETREILADPYRTKDDPDGRNGVADFTHLPFVTIDNPGSRDLDQALLVERTSGGYVVWYALADASFYIQPESAFFQQSIACGTSFYLGGMCVPMLPEPLSEGLISLNPEVDRRALIFQMFLDEEGRCESTELVRGEIRSQAQLTYEGVQRFFDEPERSLILGEPFDESLRLLGVVGELRRALAGKRDVIQFERAEPRIRVSADQMRFDVTMRQRNNVEKWNEQISLLCNSEGGRLLEEAADNEELQSIFRIHLPPVQARVRELKRVLREIAEAHNLSGKWRWDHSESLADFVANLPRTERATRIRKTMERQIMRVNRASEFSDTIGPHHALGVRPYARFSSPMREVVGIFTHKEMLEAMGQVSPHDRVHDAEIRQQVVEAGNRAKELQRKLRKEVALLVISDVAEQDLALPEDERPRRLGTVVGLRATRVYVELDDFPIEVKVYNEDLEASYGGAYTEVGAQYISEQSGPTFSMGDAVTVVFHSWDEGRRRYRLLLSPLT